MNKKANTKTQVIRRGSKTTLIISTLVWMGTAVRGTCYEPIAKKVANIHMPYVGKHKHDPYTCYGDWKRSEERKREIMQRVVAARLEIRKMAQQRMVEDYNAAGRLIDTVLLAKGVRKYANDEVAC